MLLGVTTSVTDSIGKLKALSDNDDEASSPRAKQYKFQYLWLPAGDGNNLEASATAADPSSFNVIRRLIGKAQVTPVKHTWGW